VEALGRGDPTSVGPFELLGRLGAGGMGTVYLGRAADGSTVAVKLLHAGFTADPEFRKRFAREISLAGAVRGAGLVRLVDGDAAAERPWMATEYIDAPSLEHLVRTGGPLTEPTLTTFGHRLAQCLARLHGYGIVHRDLKPSNVLVADDGPTLIDFGIARTLDATAITADDSVIGTPAFMSPEQAAGSGIGPASDVFSLGSVLTFAATGAAPFGDPGDAVAILRRLGQDEPDLDRLPSSLRPVVAACLAKDPAARPTAAEVAARLGDAPAAGSPLNEWDPRSIGPYRLCAVLGAGGMGKVYLGERSTPDGTQVAAVKVVHDQFATDNRFRQRFAREIAVARAVGGPSIAALVDADPDAPVPWLATEYVEGPSLEQQVATAVLPEAAVLRLAAGLADALQILHAGGIVHRDLKPSNVLLGAAGPKLIDFGIARALDETAITRTGGVLGAPGFMSPEQAAGHEVGPPSDVFSLASVVVFAATGRGPFGASTTPLALLRRVIDDRPDLDGLSPQLRGIVEPCFAKEPADRPTAAELARRLADPTVVLAGNRAGGPRDTRVLPTDPPRTGVSRRGLLIGGVIGLAATAGGILWATRSTPRPPRWSVDVPGTARLSVTDGVVYLLGHDSTVRSIASRDGTVRWTYALQDTNRRYSDKSLAAGGSYFIEDKPGLCAIDLATGRLRWSLKSTFLVTAARDLVVALQFDDRWSLLGLDPDTGATQWAVPSAGAQPDAAAVRSGRVFLVAQKMITALDARTGAVLWQQPRPAQGFTWTVADAGFFLTDGRQAVGLDPASGTTRWRKDLQSSAIYVSSAAQTLQVSGDALCVYTSFDAQGLAVGDGTVRWLVTDAGRDKPEGRLWVFDEGCAADAAGVFIVERGFESGTSISGPDSYRIAARSNSDGATRWTADLADSITGLTDVLVALESDTLYAVIGPDSSATTGPGRLLAFDRT
jgi:serine/threonine protein kinase/outer membrane protein assembly factor BamB